MTRELERLFTYDDWANKEALASLRRTPSAHAARRLAHILGAQRTWLQRITGGAPAEVWPEPDLAAGEAQLAELRRRWRDVLAAEDVGRTVAYTNTKGRRFTSTVGEILVHVVLHGAYHRGQIASDVRAAGGEPAYTDFIHAAREKLV
jgi:uncharacterized damage-inducible protein DinB